VGWWLVSLSSVEKSRIRRFFLISLFLIMAFGGLAGLSRSTLLSLIVSISVYLLFAKKVKKVIKVILSGLIIVLLIINLFSDLVLNFSQRLDGGIEIQNETRTEIWLDYFEDLPSYFLFGALDGDYTKYSSFSMGPHSTILNWLVQFGILGVLGFVALLIGFIKSIKRIKKHFYN